MTRQPKLLVSWYTDPCYIPPFLLSESQITVGPRLFRDQPQAMFAGWTPPGRYDLAAALKAQAITGAFDAIVVWSDSSASNQPMNLEAFRCPKVLCVGDTHHQQRPLRTLIEYALEAGYDFIVSSHNRHHLHWFMEAGFQRVAWIPGLKVLHMPRAIKADRTAQIAFVGQVGFHPRRQRMLDTLARGALPLAAFSGAREAAADLYASSTVSFNASLNGDLNLRVFEILSAGGCLLTDRLSSQSGLELILKEDKDFFAYDTPEELIEKARYLLRNPGIALDAARSGNRAFTRRMLPRQRAQTLINWVFGGKLEEIYRPDGRAPASCGSAVLDHRLHVYEELQELHRQLERPKALFAAALDPIHVADARDLHRLQIVVDELTPATNRNARPSDHPDARWDCVVVPSDFQVPAAVRYSKLVSVPRSEAKAGAKN